MAIRTFTWPAQSVSASIPGVATESTLAAINTKVATETTLAALSAKLPAQGQALMAASQPVVIASNQSAVPISASSLPLPTGAATETTLSALNTKTPALGQAVMASSQPVVIASNQSAVPISASALPLPTGAATETTLAAINTKVATETTLAALSAKMPAQGQALMAASQPVVIASNQSAVPVSASSLPLPTGAATETTLSALNTKTPALGQALMASSQPVVIASNQSNVPVTMGGRSKVLAYRNDYSSTTVTTSAYTQIVASTSDTINRLHIFDSSGQIMILATGAAAAEVDLFYIPPGGIDIDIQIASATRLSVKALDGNASSGNLIITALS